MPDYGLTISAPNTTVKTATGTNVLLSAKYPFEKLDTTNVVSFQNINLFFSRDTPNPAVGASNSTLVYSFAHGYKYIPRFWALIKNTSASPPMLFGNEIYLLLAQTDLANRAEFTMTVDATNVNFYVNKINASGTVPSLASKSLFIRCYVFVDNIA